MLNVGSKVITIKKMKKLKSLKDISDQRDRLKVINRINMKSNKAIKNRADVINECASNCRTTRGLSIFDRDRTTKK